MKWYEWVSLVCPIRSLHSATSSLRFERIEVVHGSEESFILFSLLFGGNALHMEFHFIQNFFFMYAFTSATGTGTSRRGKTAAASLAAESAKVFHKRAVKQFQLLLGAVTFHESSGDSEVLTRNLCILGWWRVYPQQNAQLAEWQKVLRTGLCKNVV